MLSCISKCRVGLECGSVACPVPRTNKKKASVKLIL